MLPVTFSIHVYSKIFQKIKEVDLGASGDDRNPGDQSDAIQFATGSRTSNRGVIAAARLNSRPTSG